ncbi:polysaccharide deacetylase family protein [Pelomonas sp. BJYL3]|uniref:polysaccharide deacetylase family protein n=1 Tax=Pelomonas sp. BJYL3 TaxID=2976697 RepID=UPI0022B4D3D1|nr:polysaccharide deacetylase family protein [Pelomonas sp. BJYL3]
MMLSLTRRFGRGKLTILSFHRLPREAQRLDPHEYSFERFKELVTELRSSFRILALTEAVDLLRAGLLKEPAVVLTFDDGYKSWIDHVAPWLQGQGLRGTFFITTAQLRGQPLWNERIEHAIHHLPAGLKTLSGVPGATPGLDVSSREGRVDAVRLVTAALKYQPQDQRREAMAELERLCGPGYAGPSCFGSEDLKALQAMGMEIGAHSVNHPILSCCSEEEAEYEIRESRADIEAVLGPLRMPFAYPNGEPGKDYTSRHVEMVRRAGYACGVSTQKGYATLENCFLQLRRFTPWGATANSRAFQLLGNLLRPPEPDLARPARPHAALMVAFHFPPQAGSSGVLRSLNFAKILPEAGWDVSLLSASASAYERTSVDLMAQVPPDIRLDRALALDVRRDLSIRGKYPELLAMPDRWSSWFFGGVRRGIRLVRSRQAQLVWSTYPILSAHLIGGMVARWTSRPWIAEFRDPVYHEDWDASRLKRWLLPRLEGWVVRSATCCVVTTDGARQLFERRYPEARGRVHVIENGYDEGSFVGAQAQRYDVAPERLLMLHSGAIYPKERDPSNLFRVMARLRDSGRIEASRLCVRFRAPGADQAIRELAQKFGVEDMVDIAGPVPYRQALQEMMGADLLLVFQGSAFNNQIPAKIYEYLRALRPILALVDCAGITAQRLSQFEGVRNVDVLDEAAIEAALLQSYDAFVADMAACRQPVRTVEAVSPTSRQHGAWQLAQLMIAVDARTNDAPLRG